MLYKSFLKKIRKCPFCDEKNLFRRYLGERKTAFLTYSLAPYARDHLLVLPKRHILRMAQLRKSENADIDKLLQRGAGALRKLGNKSVSILVRDGDHNPQKSVAHLHYHIIPSHRIGDLDILGKKRKLMTGKEIERTIEEIKKALRKSR